MYMRQRFTGDRDTWKIDKQFLWGPGLLISPALEKNQTEVTAYFQILVGLTILRRRNPFGLIVSLDDVGQATGSMFWDDGDSIDSIATKKFLLLTFSVTKNKLTMNYTENGFVVKPRLENIFIFGLKDGKVKASEGHSSYHSQTKSLNITGLNWSLNKRHELFWSTSDSSAVMVPVHALRNILIVFTSVFLNKYLY